jgi:hypothetical protein
MTLNLTADYEKDSHIQWSKLISSKIGYHSLEVFAQFLLFAYSFDNLLNHLKVDYRLTSGDLFLLFESALFLIGLVYIFTPFLLSVDVSKASFSI